RSLHPLHSSAARGLVTAVDASGALYLPVVPTVLTHDSAERLAATDDREFAVLQDPDICFRGQIVAAVVADTPEGARYAASLVRVQEQSAEHYVLLTHGHHAMYRPDEHSIYPYVDTI